MRSPPMLYAVAIIVLAAAVAPAHPHDTSEASYRRDLQTFRAELDGLRQTPAWASACTGITSLRTRVQNTRAALDREAQAAEERFPNSPHAPERKWIVVRSLVELKRFQEARDEAARMVARFPNNSWATDAQRHLLVHPLGQPPREEQQPTL